MDIGGLSKSLLSVFVSLRRWLGCSCESTTNPIVGVILVWLAHAENNSLSGQLASLAVILSQNPATEQRSAHSGALRASSDRGSCR